MNAVYDVDYFIKKFEAIPEDRWCVGAAVNQAGQKCALGHCITGPDDSDLDEFEAIRDLFRPLNYVSIISDGRDERYPQPTPRARILAALNDIKNGKVAK